MTYWTLIVTDQSHELSCYDKKIVLAQIGLAVLLRGDTEKLNLLVSDWVNLGLISHQQRGHTET